MYNKTQRVSDKTDTGHPYKCMSAILFYYSSYTMYHCYVCSRCCRCHVGDWEEVGEVHRLVKGSLCVKPRRGAGPVQVDPVHVASESSRGPQRPSTQQTWDRLLYKDVGWSIWDDPCCTISTPPRHHQGPLQEIPQENIFSMYMYAPAPVDMILYDGSHITTPSLWGNSRNTIILPCCHVQLLKFILKALYIYAA